MQRAVTVLLLLTLMAPAAVMPAASSTTLASRSFGRSFDSWQIGHQFSAELNEEVQPELRIRLSSSLSGNGLGRETRSGLVCGYVALELPSGIEPAGDLRMYYLDSAGREQFLYSAGFPDLPRYAGLAGQPDFKTTGTEATLRYLRQAAKVLDPAVNPLPPADIALRKNSGEQRGPLLHCAWLLPVNISQTALPDLFDPAGGGVAPDILARLRLRKFSRAEFNAADSTPTAKLFVGALSIAAAVVDAPASLAPPGAVLLSELDPRRYPAQAPATGGDASAAQAESDQPMLIFSGHWLSWETVLELPADLLATVHSVTQPRLTPAPAPSRQQPATGTPRAAHEVGEALDAKAPLADSASTARQVELGTLPSGDGEAELPLRPITGSAGVRASAAGQPGFGSASQGATLPPLVGYPGSSPGSTLFYGPGGPPNIHGGTAPPPMAAPGLGTMVLIPAGDFIMGTDAGTPYGEPDELPQHSVNLPDFYIDKYPVTNRQFGEFVVLAGYKPDGDWQRYSSPSQLDMPVRNVSWNDANAYARWAGKRLPTEAEWEKAARGTDGRLFPWGNNWAADILPRGELGYQLLVAPKAMSPYGVMAMAGVLWQWTASPLHDYPYNPDARGEKYVLRGGAFSNGRNVVRCANRYAEPRQMALNTFSFRCVKDKP